MTERASLIYDGTNQWSRHFSFCVATMDGWIGACRATSAVVHRSFLSTSSRALHHPAPAGRQRKTHRSPRARIVAAGRAETGKSRPGKRPARHGFPFPAGLSGRTHSGGDGDGDGNVRDNVPPGRRARRQGGVPSARISRHVNIRHARTRVAARPLRFRACARTHRRHRGHGEEK